MAMNYHPEIGAEIFYRAWGMPIPVHDALSYALYFGGPGYGFLHAPQRGRSAAYWRKLRVVVNCLVALADLAALHSGIWLYYGPQPFVVSQFPVTWMFCNVASMYGFAAVVHMCLSHFKGFSRALTIFISPVGLSMVWAAVCLPIGNALHSDSGPWLVKLAACVSIAISLVAIRYFCSVSGRRIIPRALASDHHGEAVSAQGPPKAAAYMNPRSFYQETFCAPCHVPFV